MIGGGIQQVPAVLRIKKLGYLAIIADRNKDAPAFAEADICVNIDARDVQSLISWILINKNKYNISGIFTLINQAPSVSLVANATNLPTLPVATVINCDNKILMKRLFKDNNLPSAKYYEIDSLEDAFSAYENFDTKDVFLKAVDSFGGKGVKKISSKEMIAEYYYSVKKVSSFPMIIMEESLDGHFIDVQGIFNNDKFYPAGDADSFFSDEYSEFKQYNPVETFNICPSRQSKEIIEECYNLLEKAGRIFDISWGPIGGDFILTDDGLKIIEIGPRLHGPNGTLQIFPKATGMKPFEFMLQCIVGDKPNNDLLIQNKHDTALCKVYVSDKNEVSFVGFKENVNQLDGVFTSYIYWKKSSNIIKSNTFLSGLASVFILGKDYQDALKKLEKADKEFYIN